MAMRPPRPTRARVVLRTPRAARGITLIEMMVAVALMVIVIALAGPSVRELLAVQRLQGIHASLVTDLQFVRSEAVRRRRSLIFQVSGDGAMSCYIVYTDAFGAGGCDCRRPPGQACTGGFEEIRTVQVPRSSSVAFAASSSQASLATFERDTGYSNPGDLRIDLASAVRGQLRIMVNATGRVSSCSPDGSIKQVPPCT
jgi:type IV fimbrial biogenesis protein FimT